jgi:glycosyltransferase involved in cell wall biosynthesis
MREERRLYIYSTVYNNANRVEASLASISKLNPKAIFVVDNFSTDGTYEKLRKHKSVRVFRVRCKRGRGRDIALHELLKDARSNDLVMNVDLDMIYKSPYIKSVKEYIGRVKDNEMYCDIGSLSTAKTNKDLGWMDLNANEDTERIARAIGAGIKAYRIRSGENTIDYVENEPVEGVREARYETNAIRKYMRFLTHLVDSARGSGYTFKEFYGHYRRKSRMAHLGYRLAYAIACAEGLYRYHEGMSNNDYVEKNLIRLYRKSEK